MMILFGLFRLIWKLIWSTIVVLVCLSLIFILYKGNQPMQVQAAPKGMTFLNLWQIGHGEKVVNHPSAAGACSSPWLRLGRRTPCSIQK
jgi:hypothetical protein